MTTEDNTVKIEVSDIPADKAEQVEAIIEDTLNVSDSDVKIKKPRKERKDKKQKKETIENVESTDSKTVQSETEIGTDTSSGPADGANSSETEEKIESETVEHDDRGKAEEVKEEIDSKVKTKSPQFTKNLLVDIVRWRRMGRR